MSKTYSSNGNLALKAWPGNKLTVIRPMCKRDEASAFTSLSLQLFAFLHAPNLSHVQNVLAGNEKLAFLVGAKERRFALVASTLACFALFHFSFFVG